MPVFCLDDRLLHGRHASGPARSSCWRASTTWRRRCGARRRPRDPPRPARARRCRRSPATPAPRPCTSRPTSARLPVAGRARRGRAARRRDRGSSPSRAQRRRRGRRAAHAGASRTRSSIPFFRAWDAVPRRPVLGAPRRLRRCPRRCAPDVPKLADLGLEQEIEEPIAGGEGPGRDRLGGFLRGACGTTPTTTTRSAATRLAAVGVLRFGCLRRGRPNTACRGVRAPRIPAPALLARATTRSCSVSPGTRGRSSRSATAARSNGATPKVASRLGAGVRPAIRSWTRACGSCGARVSCTTAPGSSSAPSSPRTSGSTGAGASAGSAAAPRRRRGEQQRQLAVDRLGRHRPPAVLPAHVQPRAPYGALRSGRPLCAPLRARAARRSR